jgi:hypothetical protein
VQNFVESEALAVFRRYQEGRALEELDALLRLLVPVVEGAICKRLGRVPLDYDEDRAHVLRKLCRSLPRLYDPARGSLFNFTTKLTENCLIDLLRRKIARDRHVVPWDEGMLERFGVNGAEHRYALSEIAYRVMQIKTTSRDRCEVAAQRWLVRNLLASDFCFYRHEAANAMTIVYSVPPERARRIFDLTLLSIRRILLDGRRLRPVDCSRLRSLKDKGLLHYRPPRLSEGDFARLCYLMHNLAPSLIESGEFTLEDVLYGPGPPREQALFSHAEALAAAHREV